MKIIDRYLAKQLCLATLFAVALLSVVLVLGNIFKQLFELLINRSTPPEFIFTFIGFILPFSLTFTLPWGFLTSVLLVLGRMSAEHELVALRSSGVSISRICRMVFVMGVLCVCCCLWINVDIAPRAEARFKEALYDLAINRPLAMFEGDKVIDAFPGPKIYIGRSEGDQLFNLLVFEVGKGQDPQKVIFARRGRLYPDPQNRRLLLDLFDARYEQRDEANPQSLGRIKQGITMQKSTLPISLEELYERNNKANKRLSSMIVRELMERIDSADPEKLKDNAQLAAQISETRTELSRRFSFSLASLAFALFAVPLAITAQRKETAVGFLLSIVVAFIYFFLTILVGWVKAKPEWHPEWLMWMPDLVFFAVGGEMYRRLCRR